MEAIRLCTVMYPPQELRESAWQHALEVNPANYPVELEDDPQALKAAVETRRLWPNGATLRVKFMDGLPAVQERVIPVAQEWSRYANIKFAFVDDDDAEIRIAFNPNSGSWSYMGTDCSLPQLVGHPTMNLGWLTPTTDQVEYDRVVLHEFGHALGLVHEHLSPAATIPWDEKKVIEYYRQTNGWDENYTRSNVLNKSQADRFTRFDAKSIMLYPVPKSMTVGGFEIPWSNSKLSKLDQEFIGLVYPFPKTGQD